jgi:hypothetical protein
MLNSCRKFVWMKIYYWKFEGNLNTHAPLWAQQHMVDRHYSLILKPWSARTLCVYAHADLAKKYSVGLQEIFVSSLCSQEENSFFLPWRNQMLHTSSSSPLHRLFSTLSSSLFYSGNFNEVKKSRNDRCQGKVKDFCHTRFWFVSSWQNTQNALVKLISWLNIVIQPYFQMYCTWTSKFTVLCYKNCPVKHTW